jgi:hypothetical protein
MTVRVGDMVMFKTRLASLKFNQARREVAEHPAIVTAVHNENFVDLTVIFNGSSPAHKNGVWKTDTAAAEAEANGWEPRE